MKRNTSLIIVSLSALLSLLACHPNGEQDPENAANVIKEALAPQDVELVEPVIRSEHPELHLVGSARAFETVNISSEVVGNIDKVLVEVGNTVNEGDPLIEVDRETFRLWLNQANANLEASKAELNLATKELERKRDLLSDKTIAQATFDQAEAAHALAAARVGSANATRDLAQRDLDRSIIRAPSDGTIAKRYAVKGQWADINQSLIELAMGSQIKVAARVPEFWMPNLSGLKGFDFTVGTSEKTYHATLYSIEPVVSQNSRSFEVVGTMKISDQAVRPGMFANITLTSPTQHTSLWLPSTAIASSDMPEIMMVADDKIVLRKVQTGRRDTDFFPDGAIEIVSGLEAEEPVIRDVSGLGRGIPVRVITSGDNT